MGWGKHEPVPSLHFKSNLSLNPRRMKITIELTDAQVKGIKHYLKEVGDIQKPAKADIKQHIDNIVHGNLQAPQESVSHYIAKYEKQ